MELPAEADRTAPPEASGETLDAPLQNSEAAPFVVPSEPKILSRAEHPISRKDIDEDALRVLYRLAGAGYKAYLVGGGVRDLLLGKVPKDFDVATDARPSRIKKLFRNCRMIGRRFRIAHVFFPDGKIIEVSTFRRGTQKVFRTERGLVFRDNEYGTPQEDALRRDITINGLFYDIESFSVIDYVGGVQDLQDRTIRTIADPDASFREDPVRMIRVQRHAARTGFEIEPATLQAIFRNRKEITTANTARLLEETLKDLRGGASMPFYRLMMETHLLDELLPVLGEQLRTQGPDHPLWRRTACLDRRIQAGAVYTTPVLLSVFLHTALLRDPQLWSGRRSNPPDVWRLLHGGWRDTAKTIRISRRDMERIAQILIGYRKLVHSLEHRRLAPTLMKKPYLWEALDFLQIDLESAELPTEIVEAWRRHAPPPHAPEPRYKLLFGKARDEFRDLDDAIDEEDEGPEFAEEGAEVEEGHSAEGDVAAGPGAGGEGRGPRRSREGRPSPSADEPPRRRRRRRRGGRRRGRRGEGGGGSPDSPS